MAGRDDLYPEAWEIIDNGLPISPRMYPCVCGEGKHAHAGKNRTGACKAVDCKRYRLDPVWELVYEAIDGQAMSLGHALRAADKIIGAKHRAKNPVLPGQWRVSVSDTDSCRRSLWYRNMPPEGFKRDWEDKREAMVGTMIHEGVEARLPLVFPWRMYEHEVTVPGLDRKSRIDCYDPITRELQDTKTAGDWRWDVIGEDGPDERTWWKVMLYALAMEEQGYPVKTVRLDYLKRANGHDEPFVRDYDRAVAEEARDYLIQHARNFDLLAEMDDVDDAILDILFPRDGTGPSSDAICKRCFARSHCWSIVKAEAIGRSPESYTHLGPDPDEAEIALAIEAKVEAAKVRLAAKKHEDVTKVDLEGVAPGRYGAFEGYERWYGGGEDWEAYANLLRKHYAQPEHLRPDIDTIDIPMKRSTKSIRWGKVRKATLDREAKAKKAAPVDATKTLEQERAEAEAAVTRAEAAAPPLRDNTPVLDDGHDEAWRGLPTGDENEGVA